MFGKCHCGLASRYDRIILQISVRDVSLYDGGGLLPTGDFLGERFPAADHTSPAAHHKKKLRQPCAGASFADLCDIVALIVLIA